MEGISIINADEKYIYEYWRIFDEVAKEGKYLGATKAFPLDSTRRFVQDSIRRKYPYHFVINKNNELVGWCDIQPKDNIDIGSLGVALKSEYRNKGIGRKLIEKTLEAAKNYGFIYVELSVRALNERAIHLYENIGFKTTKVIRDGICIENITEDVIEMRIEL